MLFFLGFLFFKVGESNFFGKLKAQAPLYTATT